MTLVHVVVPEGIDNPERPSGGNVYDRWVCRGLAALGWTVHERSIPGRWPRADGAELAGLAEALDAVPNGGLVLLDGLIASAAPEAMSASADRLRLVVLVHMPLGAAAVMERASEARDRERHALSCAEAVIATSSWTRDWLLENYALPDDSVGVVEPGVDSARIAPGTATGGQLVCVAAVTPAKGHDILLSALAMVKDLAWECVCVGSLDLDPEFVAYLEGQARRTGIADRIRFTGPLTGVQLDGAYSSADALVLPSRAETYGMVITEALARGLPVIATSVGGVGEAVGATSDGVRPGLLVPPGQPAAYGAALRCWLVDEDRRRRLREAARQRRRTLISWDQTAKRLSRRLADVTRSDDPAARRIASPSRYRPADRGASR